MEISSRDLQWIKKTKWLSQLLIISVTLNIGFLISFAYMVWKDQTSITDFSDRPPARKGDKEQFSLKNSDLLSSYSLLTFPELVALLQDGKHVEEGYTKRDLALACLVAFHHFPLEKALGTPPSQKRMIRFRSPSGEEQMEIAIFPSLAEFQYQAISKFAKTEKWPLTSQGLFFEIQRFKHPRDPSLLEAFYLTPEFYTVVNLFSDSEFRVEKEILVEMLASANWEMIQSFFEQQKVMQDFSIAKRRLFLLDYLKKRSKVAAMLFLQTDREFVEKKLEDDDVIAILDLTETKTLEAEKFAKGLLTSARSDRVWKMAAKKLYTFCGEPMGEPYDHKLALAKFVPDAVITPVKEEPAKPLLVTTPLVEKTAKKVDKKKIHVVQEGDSLWKISRKYRVSVEEIMKVNHLTSEKLRTGKELEIPTKPAQ